MKLYLSKTHSDVEGELAEEGKLGIIYGTKEEINNLAKFFNEASEYLKNNEYCHLQFRDYMKDWDKNEHIDIEINVESKNYT